MSDVNNPLNAILAQAAQQQIFLYVESGKLKFKAKPGALDEQLKAQILAHKPALIEFLSAQVDSNGIIGDELEHIALLAKTEAPLSFAQQRLWVFDQMQGGSTAYNLPMALRFVGPFDVDKAEQAMSRIVERHQSLRTVFTQQDGEVLQQVKPAGRFAFARFDVSLLAAEQQAAKIEQLITAENAQLFDLSKDLMVRGSYIRCPDEQGKAVAIVLFNLHHIASDGWSMSIMINEFVSLYASDVELASLKVQYSDYAHWQRNLPNTQGFNRQLQYWKEHLADAPAVHSLPLDFARASSKTHQGAQVLGQIDKPLSEVLNQLAHAHQVTLFMLLHSAFSLMLSRHSNTYDIVIGTPMANRQRSELEGMIGFFINTLALRTDMKQPDLASLLQHVKQVNLDAQSCQDVPLDYLVEHCNVARTTSHMPLVEVQFSMDSTELGQLSLADIHISSLASAEPVARFDLNLAATVSEQGVHLEWVYDKGLFKRESIERFNRHFCHLLAQFVAKPQAPLASLSMLDSAEIEVLTQQYSGQDRPIAGPLLVHQRFESCAKQYGDKVAVVSDERQLSYRQLNEAANRLAHFLIERGVKPDTLVGVCCERSASMMIAILAVLKAGGAYLPLDPGYPLSRVERILDDSLIDYVITERELMQSMPFDDMTLALLDQAFFEQLYGKYPSCDPHVEGLRADHLAYVIYTSGSTGQPKGVMIEHQGVVNLCNCQQSTFQIDDQSAVLHFASMSFDAAVSEWTTALLGGASLYICDDGVKKSADKLIDYIRAKQITHATIPPALIQLIPFTTDLPLQTLITAGDAIEPHLASKWAEHYRLINGYGPTESTVCISMGHLYADEPINMGKPLFNSRVYLLSPEQTLVPFGAVGELCVSGVGLARGYLNNPQLTNKAFIDNPLVEHSFDGAGYQRLYRTGDLARFLPDGRLVFVGRVDEQVKVRGFRVEPGEIQTLLEQHQEVKTALVVVDKQAGGALLVAYVVLHDDNQIDNSELLLSLKQQLKHRLPEYMVPGVIMPVSDIRLTVNGKVDKSALPKPQRQSLGGEYVGPTSEFEHQLVAIWSQLFDMDAKLLSVNGNFFELGGHSLLAIKMLSAIKQTFNRELEIKDVFDTPDIASLAAKLEQQGEQLGVAPLVAVNAEHYPLSFSQQRLWFIDNIQGSSSEYNIPLAYKISGDFDVDAAQMALNIIIERHQILRTVYRAGEVAGDEQQASQVLLTDCELSIQTIDLSALNDSEQTQQVTRLLKLDAAKPFDLSLDLMIRASYLLLNDKQGVLLFNIHHIAADGWSMGILVDEFSQAYRAAVEAKPVTLPKLALQYRDFAWWQRQNLNGEALAQQLAFWQQQLADAPVLHQLPLDFARSGQKSYQGEVFASTLNGDIVAKLNDFCRDQQVTPFMLLHGILAQIIAKHSNQQDIVIGTAVAGRREKAVEGLIGFFINTLALRVNTDFTDFGDYLAHVKQVNLDAQDNQDVPFEQVVEQLARHSDFVRGVDYIPLVEIQFMINDHHSANPDFSGLTLESLAGAEPVAKFDLNIAADFHEQQLAISWEYDKALFSAKTISRLAEHFNRLLTGVLTKAEQHSVIELAQLNYLTEAEISQLNDYRANFVAQKPQYESIALQFEARCRQQPDALALIADDLQLEPSRLTYRQLDHRANQLGAYLRQKGVTTEVLVGVVANRSIDTIVSILAILKAGGGYLPLEPNYPQSRLEHMIEDSQVTMILGAAQTVPCNRVQWIDITHTSVADELDKFSGDNLPPLTDHHGDSLAYVIYTSGSTGQPKGVVQSHRNVQRLVQGCEQHFAFDDKDVWTLFHSLAFDFSVWELFGALLSGGQLVIPAFATTRDPERFVALCQRLNVSVLNQTPSAFGAFTQQVIEQNLQLPKLKTVIFGGEALQYDSLNLWWQHVGEHTKLVNMYGITETTVHVTFKALHPDEPANGSIGQPLIDQLIYLLDSHGALAPIGAVAQMYVGGAGLARGYLNNPQLSATRFITNRFADQSLKALGYERLYRTGDLARYNDEGELQYLGRNDQQLKVRGFRIEAGEIEYRLNQLAGVKESLLLAFDKQGQTELVAYVIVAESGANKGEDGGDFMGQLRQQLSQQLPTYMVPAFIVPLTQWPLTANGKVDKSQLPKPTISPTKGHQPPVGEQQILLANVWAKVLNIEPTAIGRDDSFFALGGHSLLIINARKALNLLGWDLPFATLYQNQSLSQLAESLEVYQAVTVPPLPSQDSDEPLAMSRFAMVDIASQQWQLLRQKLEPIGDNVQDIYPLSPLQKGMLYHALAAPEADPYIIKSIYQLQSEHHFERFVWALKQVIQRHDSLRTLFVHQGLDQPLQVVLKSVDLPIYVIDAPADVNEQSNSSDIEKFLHHYQLTGNNFMALDSAPLLQLHLLKCGSAHHVVLFNHHIVEDNLSGRVIESEMVSLLLDSQAPLAKPRHYREFIYQGLQLESSAAEQFFSRQLGGYDQVAMPFAIDSHYQLDNEQDVDSKLPDGLNAQLKALAIERQVSVAAIFHWAWGYVVGRISNQLDVVFGSVFSGRMQHSGQGEQLVGMCLNTLPLRFDTASGSIGQSLDGVAQQLNQLLQFEQVPLTEVQRFSDVAANTPLFHTLLNCRLHQAQDSHTQKVADRSLTDAVTFVSRVESTNYPLTASVDNMDDGTYLRVQSTDGIDAKQVAEYVINTLGSLVKLGVDAPMTAVQMLSSQQSLWLLHSLNDNQTDYPRQSFVAQLFEQCCEQNSQHTALVFAQHSYTYQQLNSQVNQLAWRLLEQGICRGDRVGIYLGREPQAVIAILAVLKVGGAFVPLDSDNPQSRLQWIIKDTAMAFIICAEFDLTRLQLPSTVNVVKINTDALQSNTTNPPPLQGDVSQQLAYVMYTSGSTGQPKGVMIPEQNITSLVCNNSFIDEQRANCIMGLSSFAFDSSIFDIFYPLLNGKTLILVPGDKVMELDYWQLMIEQHQVDTFFVTTALFNYLVNEKPQLLNSGPQILFGGEKANQMVIEKALKQSPNVLLHHMYGPTETTVYATEQRLTLDNYQQLPIGFAIGNKSTYVLDEVMRLTPVGAVGQLYIGHEGLALGYLNNPQLSEQKFVKTVFDWGDETCDERLYQTGDMVQMLANGCLTIIGRIDNQVKIRGLRIELGEIEHHLHADSRVQNAVVLAQPVGDGTKVLIAYVSSTDGALSATEYQQEGEMLKARLAENLPAYMVPAIVVVLDELPLNLNGKIDKGKLPQPEASLLTGLYTAPQTEGEKQLQCIWAELLNLDPDKISIDANFFVIGGHSLLAVRLLAAIEREFGLKLDVRDLFEAATIAELAQLIDGILARQDLAQSVAEQSDEQGDDQRQELVI